MGVLGPPMDRTCVEEECGHDFLERFPFLEELRMMSGVEECADFFPIRYGCILRMVILRTVICGFVRARGAAFRGVRLEFQ